MLTAKACRVPSEISSANATSKSHVSTEPFPIAHHTHSLSASAAAVTTSPSSFDEPRRPRPPDDGRRYSVEDFYDLAHRDGWNHRQTEHLCRKYYGVDLPEDLPRDLLDEACGFFALSLRLTSRFYIEVDPYARSYSDGSIDVPL